MCYCGIAQETTINYPPNATGDDVIYQLTAKVTNSPECSIECSKSPSIKTTLEIPSSVIIGDTEYTVTSIPENGFNGETNFVGDLLLPNTIQTIGQNPFAGCTGFNGTLYLPVGVFIGNKAFLNCTGITNMIISEDVDMHTNGLGNQVNFKNCTTLYLFVPLTDLPKKVQDWINSLDKDKITIITPENMSSIVATPTFNPQSCGFTGSIDVTISSEEGATIYYTTNGDTPTTGSTQYQGAITINATTTIKALAVNGDKTPSQAQATYTKINSIESPTFSPAEGTYNNAQSVTMTSATEGATIYYTTDGTTPTTESTPYTEAITVDGNANIKAIAVTAEGTSSVSTVSYYFHAVTPQFSPETNTIFTEGEELEINISSTTVGATIYYTIDGSDPKTSDTKIKYSEVITLSEAAIIKAYAVKEGYEPSEVATATYIEQGTVLTPILSLTPGTYQTAQECTISCGTEGATIYYSINGNEYVVIEDNTTISITQNTSISAYAIKEGMTDSQVISETYTLIVPTPTINPGGDKYIEAQNVTISAVEGATIYYTTDGTTPTTESTLYTGAITVSEPTTIKATAYVEGWTMSNPATAEYDFYVKLQAPVISKPSGNYSTIIKVTITCEEGATIHYTTDDSTPYTEYNGDTISVSPSTTTIIKAIAVKEGMLNSDIATAVYNDNAILTFTGEGSWNNANNWNKGYVPSPEHRVAIAGNVIIEPSDIININYINNLKTAFIPNPGTITIKDGGQLIYKTADIEKVRIEKSITGYGTDPETTQGWYAFSTPIANDINEANYQNLTNGDFDLFSYNEKDWHWHNYEKQGEFSTLNLGQGYLYANSANTTITSVGTPNYNTIEFTLSATANPVFPENAPNAQNYNLIGFNLIGNPYTYNIGKGDGQAIPNTNLKPGYYTLTTDGQWVSVNDTEPIKVGTSIFVETSNGSDDNGKKITIDNIPYSQATQTRASVNESLSITVANEKYNDVAHINFGNDSEKGLRKIAHMNDDIQMVYVPVKGVNYAIANVDENASEVPVSFETYVMGKYTISVKANNIHDEVYLLDKVTGEKIDILSQDYTFVATSSDKAERFSLLFVNNNDDDDTESTNQIFAYINNGEIIISDIEGSGDVKIYDVMGRLVIAENANGSAKISTESFTNGIYIINLIDGDGIKTQKIAIRK